MPHPDTRPTPRQLRGKLSALVAALLLATAGAVAADAREDFLAAEIALKKGDAAVFEGLSAGLHDFPLFPYLRFEALKRRLDQASGAEVEQFLAEQAATPLAERLRLAWLERLAERGAWTDYARLYVADDSTERRCLYLRALLETGRASEVIDQVEPLWRVGHSQPKACDAVFAAWQEAGRLTEALVWDRVAAAMAAGETSLARYLRGSLPPGEKVWLERWLAVHDRPELVLDPDLLTGPHPQRKRILVHGVARLARQSPGQAADAWDLIEAREDISPALAQETTARIGLALAEASDARGLDYLEQVPAREDNQELQERRLRAALRLGAWPRIVAWVAVMPDGQRKAEHWLYWEARALGAMGETDAAERIYAQAARERSLWGFLAAERVGAPYRLDHRPTPVAEERVQAIAESAAGRRIAELSALGRTLDVRREWTHQRRKLEGEDLKAAAVLAQRWGSPDQAIFTLARTGFWDDLDLRFPLLYADAVSAAAGASGLDQSWIYAILRQESAFNPQAVSHAGAQGLMQLMPATAQTMARALDLPGVGRTALFDPQTNIALGSGYLARMQARYAGNPVLAAAAYNAGPGNVDKWLPAAPVDADIWAATIPFRETRGYVRRVLAYRLIYDHRLGHPIAPLSGLMRPVGQAGVLTGAEDPAWTEPGG